MQLRRARPLLGTLVDITVRGGDAAALAAALATAFGAVARIQALMSFHDPASEVSRLNRSAAGGPMQVSPETWQVLALAQRVAAASEGCFDIAIAPLLVKRGHLPPPDAPAASCEASWRDIELEAACKVRFHRPLWIDLGGIAKGFAVDLAVAALRGGGAESGLVNAGGDMRAFGPGAEPFAIRDPRRGCGVLASGDLHEESLASSARPAAGRAQPGVHIDPRAPGRESCMVSVSVAAAECALADALTKVVMARGLEAAGLLQGMGAAALILDTGGGLFSSRQPFMRPVGSSGRGKLKPALQSLHNTAQPFQCDPQPA